MITTATTSTASFSSTLRTDCSFSSRVLVPLTVSSRSLQYRHHAPVLYNTGRWVSLSIDTSREHGPPCRICLRGADRLRAAFDPKSGSVQAAYPRALLLQAHVQAGRRRRGWNLRTRSGTHVEVPSIQVVKDLGWLAAGRVYHRPSLRRGQIWGALDERRRPVCCSGVSPAPRCSPNRNKMGYWKICLDIVWIQPKIHLVTNRLL